MEKQPVLSEAQDIARRGFERELIRQAKEEMRLFMIERHKIECAVCKVGREEKIREIFEEWEKSSVETDFEGSGKYRSWQMTELAWQSLKSKYLKEEK